LGEANTNTSITLGNPDAEVEITMFTNPHCNPCAKMHQDLEELLASADESVKVRLYFLSFPQREKTTQELLTLCLSAPDNQARQEILHTWFEKKQKNEVQPTEQAEQIRQAHQQYAEANQIEATPTIFVQGFQLPQGYQIQELHYQIENLQNFGITTN
jgi:protein-disulfide isomerase